MQGHKMQIHRTNCSGLIVNQYGVPAFAWHLPAFRGRVIS
jgi:hypothetical protein